MPRPARPSSLAPVGLALICATLAACSQEAPPVATGEATGATGATSAAMAAPAPEVATAGAHEASAVLEHLHRWSDRIVQGGEPRGDEAFQQLQDLGVKTVISVDGAVPDVEGAARHGMTYVHVPIGYDDITKDEQARIIKAVRDSNGPVYIHCHHGLHRGPAAAAVARVALDGVSIDDAHAGLKESGCSPAYDGLYATVREFVAPSAQALAALPALPSAVVPEGLLDSMVHVDGRWDYFKAVKAAGWKAPADAPDRTPGHEMTILRELFVEMDRLDESKGLGDDFLTKSAAMQADLVALEAALAAGDHDASAKAFDRATASCKACHTTYRD